MDDRIPAVIVGVLFSILNAVVTVYLALKVGMADGIYFLLLFVSVFVFMLTRTRTPRAFVYMTAIMTSSIAATVAYTDGLGAIVISGEAFTVPDVVMMAILALSSVAGIVVSSYFADYFLKGNFPWPGSKVTASIVNMVAAEKAGEELRRPTLRMVAAGLFAGGIVFLRGLGVIPEVLGTTVAGLGVSPMMLGIGMLIGFRACLNIALGALASLAIYLFIEGGNVDYTAHMRSPWVFSTAISMMVTTAFITLYIIVRPIVAAWFATRSTRRKASLVARDGGSGGLRSIRGRELLLLATVAAAAALLQVFVGVPVWAFLISLPIAVLFMVIEARGRGEVAMSVGISSFVIILIVGLAFDDIVPLLILEGFVVAMVMSFSLRFQTSKMAEYSNVSAKGLMQMLAIGAITGSVICVPIIRLLNSVYGIGTDALPAPYSVMWLEMANSAVSRVMSPSISLWLILAGIAIAFVLHRYKLSAVAVAMGLILPVSIGAALLVGGIVAWYIAKKGYLKDDNGITASGLIAGDILVGLAMSLRTLF